MPTNFIFQVIPLLIDPKFAITCCRCLRLDEVCEVGGGLAGLRGRERSSGGRHQKGQKNQELFHCDG